MPRTHADLIGWSFRTCQGLLTPCECPRVQERWLQPLPTGAECVHQADRARCYIWLALSGLHHHLSDQTSAVNKNDRLFIYTSIEGGQGRPRRTSPLHELRRGQEGAPWRWCAA